MSGAPTGAAPCRPSGRARPGTGEGHTNRAAVVLANKLARIAWAVWKHERTFDGDHALQLAAAA